MSDLAHLVRIATSRAMRSVNTCLPGMILSYDAGGQRASVRPMLSVRQPDGREEEMPVLNSVPVIWPRGGGASITLPVRSGDGCLLLFTQRSIDEFKASGQITTPADPRAFDLSDAVAIMGFVSFGAGGGADDAIELRMGDTVLKISEDGFEFRGDITIYGEVVATGEINGEVPL